ncbi:MAG: anti-sigma factor domain-containing protein, partial [Streptosporangiaceae bacterium]
PRAASRARPRRVRALLAVAAAALVAAGGIWAGVIRGPATSPPSSASCAAAGRCHQVVLTLAASGGRTAKVRVRDGSVWLLPGKLPPDRTARQVYVLWQITGARSPKAVGSFDVSPGHRGPIRIGALPGAYSGTRAFAVSLEPGRAIPVRPSHLVAFGLVGD